MSDYIDKLKHKMESESESRFQEQVTALLESADIPYQIFQKAIGIIKKELLGIQFYAKITRCPSFIDRIFGAPRFKETREPVNYEIMENTDLKALVLKIARNRSEEYAILSFCVKHLARDWSQINNTGDESREYVTHSVRFFRLYGKWELDHGMNADAIAEHFFKKLLNSPYCDKR